MLQRLPAVVRAGSLLVLLLLVFAAFTFAEFNTQNSHNSKKAGLDESQFPVVDESTPEVTDPAKRAIRVSTGAKFHNAIPITSNPNFNTVATVYDWPENFSSLPVAESNAILIGRVVSAEAHLSTDKTAVYSEFSIKPVRVLKDENRIAEDSPIIATRYGGRVRFSNGNTQLFYNTGQGMPRIGNTYVLFLRRDNEDIALLTGYELRAGRVVPLDSGTPNFKAHENLSAEDFIKQIQQKINSLAIPSPN